MTGTVNPQMVELARNARGLTQADLASQLSFTQATLSRIERGLAPVDETALAELAGALQFPSSFFFQQGGTHNAKLKYARVRRSASAKLLDKIDADNNIRARAIKELFKPFEFEQSDLPDMPIHPIYGSAKHVARALRERWRLPRGPIPNLTRLVESKGLFVVHADFFGCPKLDGITYQFSGEVPDIIFLNQYASSDRMRFTLAHELGYRIMHAIPVGWEQAKSEADDFASEFMVPDDEIRPYLRKLTLNSLIELKKYWGMSMAFFVYKAQKLKVVNERQAKYLRFKISEVSDGKREPPETDIPREEPLMVKQMIELHRTRLGYSTEELCAAVHLQEADYRRMFEPERPRAKIFKLPNAALAGAS
jgi:Zn-dependent peptidase ImmA (M78 family)/DNA-binding XRE family transcriptional regulator